MCWGSKENKRFRVEHVGKGRSGTDDYQVEAGGFVTTWWPNQNLEEGRCHLCVADEPEEEREFSKNTIKRTRNRFLQLAERVMNVVVASKEDHQRIENQI